MDTSTPEPGEITENQPADSGFSSSVQDVSFAKTLVGYSKGRSTDSEVTLPPQTAESSHSLPQKRDTSMELGVLGSSDTGGPTSTMMDVDATSTQHETRLEQLSTVERVVGSGVDSVRMDIKANGAASNLDHMDTTTVPIKAEAFVGESHVSSSLAHPEALQDAKQESVELDKVAVGASDSALNDTARENVVPGIAMAEPGVSTGGGAEGRQLDVQDALSYLDNVKQQFFDRPDVYNNFLDIMKDFKGQLIDTPGVIERVSALFFEHPMLIQGFNTFLPMGYRIECSVDAHDTNLITVTTPSGTTTQTTGRVGNVGTSATQQTAVARTSPELADGVSYTQEQINPAMAYVTKIKERFADRKDLYQEFLDILNLSKNRSPIDESHLAARIAKLFQNAPDLLSDFQVFIPQGILPNSEMLSTTINADASSDRDDSKLDTTIRRRLGAEASGSGLAAGTSTPSSGVQKRKRKIVEKEKEREREMEKERERDREREREKEAVGKSGSSRAKKAKHHHTSASNIAHGARASSPSARNAAMGNNANQLYPSASGSNANGSSSQQLPPAPSTQLFTQIRQYLNRETYNEFLQLLNLFTQEFIDMRTLVERSYLFLGTGDLMSMFKEFIGWDNAWDNNEGYWDSNHGQFGVSMERESGRDGRANGLGLGLGLTETGRMEGGVRCGPSYRRLPASEINVPCSGRDEMCRSVLNDEWASHPSWSNEDAGFVSHKKNPYEEALHRSEEERHEYDFHIEGISRTIAMLEPLAHKIQQMSPEERAHFKLKSNFSGANKAIHQRIVKKIYGRDVGMEVVQAIHDTPSVAIPVVLKRLKQKEEEWRRAQREWNKVWREVDARNYQKSLDHQGVTFKANDKKMLTTKTFVSQIEAIREEQRAKRAGFVDPLFARGRVKHQLEFVLDDMSVLQDAIKLTFSFLDRMNAQVSYGERRRVEVFLRNFIPMFFMVDMSVFNSNLPFPVTLDGLPDPLGVDSLVLDDYSTIFEISEELYPVNGTGSGPSRSGRNGRRSQTNDLRKKLLKSTTQDKSAGRRARASGLSSNQGSRRPSPSPVEQNQTGQITGEDSMRTSPVSVDGPGADKTPGPTSPIKAAQSRHGTFFSNAPFYSLLRLIEILYSRLLSIKRLGQQLANDNTSDPFSVSVASELALLQSNTPEHLNKVVTQEQGLGLKHAAVYYEYFLESCERLFDNQIDQTSFEDILRYMFGIKAYVVFTIDKVMAALVKQVQNILSDSKCLAFLEALRRERDMSNPTSQDRNAYRRTADTIIATPDDALYRIDWNPERSMMEMQILGKDDFGEMDYEVLSERWKTYIDSFVSETPTTGVVLPGNKRAYLRRNLTVGKLNSSAPRNNTRAKSGLETRICVQTYRLFFVSDTEDEVWRDVSVQERVAASKRVRDKRENDKAWLKKFGVSAGAITATATAKTANQRV